MADESGSGAFDCRRRREAPEHPLPEGFRDREVLLLHPEDVVAVRRHIGNRRRAPAFETIEGRQLPEQQRRRPSLEQDVMERPDEPPFAFAGPHQREAHERRVAQPKWPAMTRHDILESRAMFGCVRIAPVELLELHFQPGVNDLQRLVRTFPVERSAQNRISVDDASPGPFERTDIEPSLEAIVDGDQIQVGTGRREGVKEHALLEWRQLVQVFDLARLHLVPISPLDSRLVNNASSCF